MPIITIIVGALLDITGIAGYFFSGRQSWTALIPSIFGTILVVCGVLAHVRPGIRKHVMHAAAATGLLGFLGSLRGLIQLPALMSGAEVARPAAVVAQSATAILCLVFVLLCVMSFIAARRKGASAPTAMG